MAMALFPQGLGSLELVLLAGVGVVVFAILNQLLLWPLRYRLKARRLGCGSVPTEPRRWPFGIDTVRQALLADRDQRIPDYTAERFAKMGRYTWKMNVLGSTSIMTAEPRNIQALLATQFDHFKVGEVRTTNMKMLLGRSIFAVDGPAWHSAREVMRPLFTRENISNVQVLERNFQSMMRCILDGPTTQDTHGRTWTAPIILATLFPRFTLDSSSEIFLGQSADSLGSRLRGEKQEDLVWALERIVPLLRTRLALRGFYWLYGNKEIKHCAEIMKSFTREAMEDAQLAMDCGADQDAFEFLETLKERCADNDEVQEQVLGLLAAGTDTTAALTSWVFYSLIRHPRVLAKLRGIVLEHFGRGGDGGEAVTFERLKACTYLQHVLQETLRRHSVVPLNSRCATRDTTLPTGGGADGTQPVFVPAGTEVNFSTHVLHRRRDLWGADADDFLPERWERPKRPGVFEYLPFNGGPRICIGQQLALTEAGFVVVRLLQEFDAIEGLDLDVAKARDYHNLGVVCGPGSPLGRHEGVFCRLRRAQP